MDADSATNVQSEPGSLRLFALLTLWSELMGAVRREEPRTSDPSSVINMAAWRKDPSARPVPAPLYRMTVELPAAGYDISYAETELLDELTGDNLDATISQRLSRDTRTALIRAIDELPPQERTVISLYYFERLTLREIKGALNVTESRVSKIHTHAILALRVRLSSLLDNVSRREPSTASYPPADASFWEVVARFHAISPTNESAAIRNGLSANIWNGLELLGFSRREIARVVGTSEKTIHRKIVTSEVLATAEGDRTMRLVGLILQTLETFGNVDKAFIWLRRPNRALQGQMPLETLVTESGAALVRRALGVIAYGGVA